jgi:hypothetical protein
VGAGAVNKRASFYRHQPLSSRFDLTLDVYRALVNMLADGKVPPLA